MRIAIVNDLRLACEALRRAVSTGSKHTVAWLATDGQQAIDLARRNRPDLILMDLIMPEVDGVEATRRIMAETPCPILVVTSTVSGNIGKVFEAMGHGALDAVETPRIGEGGELIGAPGLLDKIARIERMTEPRAAPRTVKDDARLTPPRGTATPLPRLVLLGASTGGPRVLAELLRRLPADLPAAVLIAQHVDQEYAGGLARWLGQFARLPVQLASAGSVPQAGRVYLAASDQHMIVAADRTLRYTADPAGWYRPSVDALFESAARHWPWPGVAALLTGMGGDGAAGLAALKQAGWMTIAQDCGSSVVWGMPKAAIELGAAQKVLATSEIGSAIVSAFSLQTSAATAKRG